MYIFTKEDQIFGCPFKGTFEGSICREPYKRLFTYQKGSQARSNLKTI